MGKVAIANKTLFSLATKNRNVLPRKSLAKKTTKKEVKNKKDKDLIIKRERRQTRNSPVLKLAKPATNASLGFVADEKNL